MLTTDLRRITKTGFIDFWRNSVTSLAAILVFTITLFIIGGLVLSTAVLEAELNVLREKVDINVYLTLDATELDAQVLTEQIETLPEVEEVTYITPQEVLAEFKKVHENDSVILQSLEELGDNPLPGEIRIRAKEPSQYEGVALFLEEDTLLSVSSGESIIANINYFDNKPAIDNITDFIVFMERLGLYVSILFIIIAVVVAFNTVKLVIFNSREEIGVMRLVGANNKYIRGPFIIEGVMYGIISSIITLIIFFPFTKWISSLTGKFFGGIDLFTYYTGNILFISALLIVSGVGLGVISSFLAVRKYLRK